jgi:hypothetical protein
MADTAIMAGTLSAGCRKRRSQTSLNNTETLLPLSSVSAATVGTWIQNDVWWIPDVNRQASNRQTVCRSSKENTFNLAYMCRQSSTITLCGKETHQLLELRGMRHTRQ